jgi:hypothetical protein
MFSKYILKNNSSVVELCSRVDIFEDADSNVYARAYTVGGARGLANELT